MEKVGFGPRFLAALIDGVGMLVVLSIIGGMFSVPASAGFGGGVTGFSIIAILMSVLVLGYTSTEIFQAGTPGKQIMKLKIKNEDGTEASEEVLKKRWAIKWGGMIISLLGTITTLYLFNFIGGLVSLVIGLGGFLIFAEGTQTLTDKLAKTGVYKVEQMSAS